MQVQNKPKNNEKTGCPPANIVRSTHLSTKIYNRYEIMRKNEDGPKEPKRENESKMKKKEIR